MDAKADTREVDLEISNPFQQVPTTHNKTFKK